MCYGPVIITVIIILVLYTNGRSLPKSMKQKKYMQIRGERKQSRLMIFIGKCYYFQGVQNFFLILKRCRSDIFLSIVFKEYEDVKIIHRTKIYNYFSLAALDNILSRILSVNVKTYHMISLCCLINPCATTVDISWCVASGVF